MFSPYYAARLRRGDAVTGYDFPAVNLALYERPRPDRALRQRAWVMSEHGPDTLETAPRALRIGQSRLTYLEDGGARIELDEDATRFFGRRGARLCGRIDVAPPGPVAPPLELGRIAAGRTGAPEVHQWQPIMTHGAAQVDLVFGQTRHRFAGTAYCDRNFGSGRLEDTFSRWCWAHGFAAPGGAGAHDGDGPAALVLYDALARSGVRRRIAVRAEGGAAAPEIFVTDDVTCAPAGEARPRDDFLWLRAPAGFHAGRYACRRVPGGGLEDTPFYARFAAELGEPGRAPLLGVGEYLDLDRFRGRALQHMLRYKTRRVGR